MTGETQTYPYVSPGPIKLPPGSLTPVEELPGDSDLDDDGSQAFDSQSDVPLSNIEEDDDDGEEEGTLRERDAVFEKIKESLSKTHRSDSVSALSTISDVSDGPHVQISDQYTSIPYGIQPKATYEHSSMHADIMGGKIYLDITLDKELFCPKIVDTLQPLYNTVRYNTVLDTTQFNDGSQKCID